MSKAIKFTLSGEFGFFKKLDANKGERFFTYSCIHKVAVLGIIGAIIGLDGYNERRKNQLQPEFYEVLKDLRISIIPKNENSYINKKIQIFNNSVGYASNENGNNLISKEQWLENPIWDIIVMLDKDYYKYNNLNVNENVLDRIEEYLINGKSVYIPYLGKNDHMANITNVELLYLKEMVIKPDASLEMASLYLNDDFLINSNSDRGLTTTKRYYKYAEFLPISLEGILGQYELKKMVHTNKKITALKDIKLFNNKDENLMFI